jgi:hypothetical protein
MNFNRRGFLKFGAKAAAGIVTLAMGSKEVEAQVSKENQEDYKPKMGDLTALFHPSDPADLEKNKEFVKDLIDWATKSLVGIDGTFNEYEDDDQNLIIIRDEHGDIFIEKTIFGEREDSAIIYQFNIQETTVSFNVKKLLSPHEQMQLPDTKNRGFSSALQMLVNRENGQSSSPVFAVENNDKVLEMLEFSSGDLKTLVPMPANINDNNGPMYVVKNGSVSGENVTRLFRGSIFYLLPKS